jgi:hypothetical protein
VVYFCRAIWTTQIMLKWFVKFAFARRAFHGILDELPRVRGSTRTPTRRRGRVDCSLEMSVVAETVRRSDTDRAAPPLLPGLDTLPSAATAAAVLNHQRVDAAAAAV